MLAANNFTKDYMAGEIQYMNEGFYPTPDLNTRLMPFYDSREKERTPTPLDCSEAHVSHSSNAHNDEDTGKENELVILITNFQYLDYFYQNFENNFI